MKYSRDEAGFSMVEIMVSAGLISIAVLASTSYFHNQAVVALRQKAATSRDSVTELLKKAVSNPATIRYSMMDSANVGLMRCLVRSAPGDCADMSGATPQGFNLYSPVNGTLLAGDGGATRACYDASGKAASCTFGTPPTANPGAVFEALAFYQTVCATDAGSNLEPLPNCDVAESTSFTFAMRPLGSGGASGNAGTVGGGVTLATVDITNQANNNVPPGCVKSVATFTGCPTTGSPLPIPHGCGAATFSTAAGDSVAYCIDSFVDSGGICAQKLVYRTTIASGGVVAVGTDITTLTWNTTPTLPANCAVGPPVTGSVHWKCC